MLNSELLIRQDSSNKYQAGSNIKMDGSLKLENKVLDCHWFNELPFPVRSINVYKLNRSITIRIYWSDACLLNVVHELSSSKKFSSGNLKFCSIQLNNPSGLVLLSLKYLLIELIPKL